MASITPSIAGEGTAPLLPSSSVAGGGELSFGPTLFGAARLLRRAGNRRLMREPSVAVREAAVEHLESRQSDWAYSRPVVALDLLWNLAFLVVGTVVFVTSRDEQPSTPLRLWIVGYLVQCVVHMACVVIEYRKRHLFEQNGEDRREETEDSGEFKIEIAKHLESANTTFSFIWWIVGFYWVTAGNDDLPLEAPQLYWLCIVFLAFDVIFVVFCVVLACVIGIAVCCCLPCIIAIMYALKDQEGASDDDIHRLAKFKFRRTAGTVEKAVNGTVYSEGGIMTECCSDCPAEHVLSAEDAECCICLTAYDDGAELRQLPCGHHFHCSCIEKWLHINATCPLCKFNIATHGEV